MSARRSIFPSDGLTPRQRETLQSLADGKGVPAHCGKVTKRRLVQAGLARWQNPDNIAITDAGLQHVREGLSW